ncbi:LCP family protein required for cell wall assembly [Kitasatospora sp. GP30]|uniref:LCP family protein n=1 Tax=Kitasatospora sp. GP30 TaxID=3035084 RepID=UPI000C7111FC|nr:LCP family protein [Kitasatospora sp. GP30]MDH6140088.1 LCP family protein required for cell wall assembly [Kitasatospora sp. GP30]
MVDVSAGGGSEAPRRARGAQPTGSAAGGRAAVRKNKKKPKRKGLRILAYTTAGLVLVAAAGGGYIFEMLNGNIKHSPLFAGTSGDAGHEKPDAFGRTPINILVIGSDSRDNPADCQIGGDCGPGANADVEMVLHVSADRSNATVMSIPRDTDASLPGCVDSKTHATMKPHRERINSTLDYGPGCTVAAVHQLTGIPIDHFMMVDFKGVVDMSDAVGGVPICVDNNVYDPYSHLKLKKGNHTLQGMSALQFVRTRHGFGDGSDLGRAAAQHIFLSSMVRQLKSAGTLTNPAAVLSLANAATKALTVDDGLAGVTNLVNLADDLNKVPPNRITMTTMQNDPDPTDPAAVVVDPAAKNLFNAITSDVSLTNGDGSKASAAAQATSTANPDATSAAPTSAPPAATGGAPKSEIVVHVKNGSGITGRAADVADALKADGYNSGTGAANATGTDETSEVTYTAGREADAQEVAASVGLPASAVKPGAGSGITLVIGKDWPSGTSFGGGGGGSSPGTPAPVNTQAALSNSSAQTADDSSKCAQVSTQDTVKLGNVGMNPTQAYAKSPDVPDSAP